MSRRAVPGTPAQRVTHGVLGQTACQIPSVNLAWLLRHPARIMPLIGSTTPERIRSALAATSLPYTRNDWYALHEARRGQAVP